MFCVLAILLVLAALFAWHWQRDLVVKPDGTTFREWVRARVAKWRS